MGLGKFRNKPCYCGSGKKFKKCHGPILEAQNVRGIIDANELPVELRPSAVEPKEL